MKLEHQADPVLGIMHWHELMTGMRVKAHVPHEPRRAVPIRLLVAIAASVDLSVFWEVQFMFFLLCSSSSRSHGLSARAQSTLQANNLGTT